MKKQLNYFVMQPRNGELYWSYDYQILYLLRGNLKLQIRDQEYTLESEDYLIINELEPYRVINSIYAEVLCIEVSASLLRQSSQFPEKRVIRFSSVEYEDKKNHEKKKIRQAIANLFALYAREGEQSHLRSHSKAMVLFDTLFSEFSVEKSANESKDEKTLNYLQDAMHYIQENYHRTITLEQTARELQLSSGYLSRIFRNVLGKHFLDVVQEIRMQSALSDLIYTNHSITDIAYDNGFSSASSFISKFRHEYGITPKLYRTQKGVQRAHTESKPSAVDSVFQSINKYVDQTIDIPKSKERTLYIKKISCNASKKMEERVDNFWKRTASIGWAVDGLSAAVQEQLRMVQREIGFSYLRFHGIFNDDMMVYDENAAGEPELNFNYCDMLFDFLLSIGLKPYLELGFIPGKLAKDRYSYDLYHAHICMPENWEKFDFLVREFMLHIVQRYGIQEIRTWKFTPMMCNHILYGFFSWEDYTNMYRHIYWILKSIDTDICIGGPGIDSSVLIYDWEHSFGPWIEACKAEQCMPDFITVKVYPYNHSEDSREFWENLKEGTRNEEKKRVQDESFVAHSLQKINLLLKQYNYTHEQIYVEAWNSTYSQSDPCSDICYRAAFIIKHILENQGNAWCLTYWTLSDHIVDFIVQRQPCSFRGGFGLITYDKIKKSGYYAMQLLNRLDGYKLQSGDGYFIAENEGIIQIVMYQYCAYNFFHGEETQKASEFEDPYYLCKEGDVHLYQIELSGLQASVYTMEHFAIGREQGGNPYERWVQMGKPSSLTEWQRNYIEQQAQPKYTTDSVQVRDGRLEIRCIVQPHDVHLIKLTPGR